MNETQQQLQQFIGTDGYADISAVRKHISAEFSVHDRFDDIFGGGHDSEAVDQPVSEPEHHPLWQAAIEHNQRVQVERETVRETRIEEVLSAETLDIREAQALELTEMNYFWHERATLGDDYSNHTPIRLKKNFRQRRHVLLGKADVVVGGSAPLASIVEVYGKEMPADLEIRWFVKWSRKTVIVRRVTYMSAGAATVEMPDGTTTTVHPSEVFEIVAR